MFIRVKTTPNSPRKSIQIVANTRNSRTGKVQQKIIRYVGIAMDDNEEVKLKQLALEIIAKLAIADQQDNFQLSLLPELSQEEILNLIKAKALLKTKLGRKAKKELKDIIPVDQVTLDVIIEEKRIIEGVHEVTSKIYEILGYDTILKTKKYQRILKDLVATRISNPSSKMNTQRILARYHDKTHDLDAIYRTLDQVYTKIDQIKLSTLESTLALVPEEVNVVLFDALLSG